MGDRSTGGLKRESGENPEQNPLLYFPANHLVGTLSKKPLGLHAPGKVDKIARDKSEDLP